MTDSPLVPAPPAGPTAATSTRRWRTALLVLGAWTVPAVISTSQTYFIVRAEAGPFSLGRTLSLQLALWWFWAFVTPLIAWVLKRWPLTRERLARHLVPHVLVAVAVSLLHGVEVAALSRAFFPPTSGETIRTLGQWIAAYLRARLQFELITYALVLLALLALLWYRQGREREVTASRLETELAQAELLALKMQLHPHFLFNTLHAIGVLIRENPEAAQRTVTLLGDLLRATLAHAGVQEVTLAEELDFLGPYLEIEQIRFQDRLSVRFEVDPLVRGARVPNLILQPLVENAVRHGVERRTEAGAILVGAERRDDALEIRVEDDGPGLPGGVPPRNGIGLSTTRARLQMLYGERQRLDLADRPEGGMVVRLRIPYVESRAAGG